ncbi:MAG: PRC-barrel domain-containing protein [Geminicoccaceae bacterium]
MRMLTLAAAGALLLGPAVAFAQADNPNQQNLPVPNPTAPAEQMGTGTTAAEPATPPTGAASLMTMTAEDLIGRDVVDGDGNSVGEVQDLMIDADKKVTHVLVDVGGFLGIGSKTVALQADQLLLSEGDGGDLVTSMAKDQIEALPGYEKQDDMWRVAE